MAIALYIVMTLLLFVVVPCIFAFFYLLTLHRTLNAVAPDRRRMAPGMVWLAAIPGWNLVWCFFNGIEIPASLRSEFVARELDDATSYGQGLGVANAVINFVNHLLGIYWLFHTPIRGHWWDERGLPLAIGCGVVAAVVVWFKFWVRMASYGERLRALDDEASASFPQHKHRYSHPIPEAEHAIQRDDREAIRPDVDPLDR